MAEGLRFNTGKTRHDLVPPFAQEQYAKVLTKGSEKYAERNWEKGMPWSKVISSLKRHVLKIESGEDYDEETGLLHSAHVMCNAAFLTEYYKINPKGDDRPHWYTNGWRVGLDVDDVLADFIGAYCLRFKVPAPQAWRFDRNFNKNYDVLVKDKNFWMNLSAKESPSIIPFEPVCYISSRGVPVSWTEEWLDKMGFPASPVYHVGVGQSKVEIAKKENLDIFIDDCFSNFAELNNVGVLTYLYSCSHNTRYHVGHKRIDSLSKVIW